MKQIKLDNNVFIPMPVTLVGCMYRDKPNFMAAGWVTRVNVHPPQIGIGINRPHATASGIAERKTFSVCFPKRADLVKTDYCGMISGKKADKSSVFTVFYGDLKTAPLIEGASLNIECSLVQTVAGPSHDFFIGEIKGVYADPECVQDGRPVPEKSGYFFLTMPDNTYWALGEPIGKAWHDGKQLKKA